MMSWAKLFGEMVATGHAKVSFKDKSSSEKHRVIAKVTSTDMSMEIYIKMELEVVYR